MAGDEIFTPEEPPSSAPSDLAKKELEAFGTSANIKPNSIIIPLWGTGHISFNPDGSVSIFAAISLLLLLIFAVLMALVGIWAGEANWLNTIFTALGHAITGVVGAIVGSSVASSKDD